MPGFLGRIPEEVWFFARIAAYAFFIGTLYWVLTYEPAGTMLLYGFGFAAGFAMLILGYAARKERASEAAGQTQAQGDETPDLEPDGPFGDESGRIPSPSIAPFAVALGAALGGLGLVLGPWLLGLGLIVLGLGGIQWLSAAQREFQAVDSPAKEVTERRRDEAVPEFDRDRAGEAIKPA